MPTLFDDVNAQCPFYQRSSNHSIICNGISDKSNLIVACKTKEERTRLKEIYCDKYYKICPIYMMLYKEYENEIQSGKD